MGIFDKEPAVIIGTVVTIVVATIATLSGNGFISDAAAGKATDITNALAQLLVLVAPLIATIITRQNVYAPATVVEIVEEVEATGNTDVALPDLDTP